MARQPRSTRVLVLLGSFSLISLVGAAYCQNVMRQSLVQVEELLDANAEIVKTAAAEATQLFSEHQLFISVVGRRGYQTSDSLDFAFRCRRELQLLTGDSRLQALSPELISEAYRRAAQLDSLAGNRKLARENLGQAIRLAEQSSDVRLLGLACNTLGVLLCEIGEYGDGEVQFANSAASLRQIPVEREALALTLRNLSIDRRALGRADAESLRESVFAVERSASLLCPATEIYIDSSVALAQQMTRLGQFEDAAQTLRLASGLLQRFIHESQEASMSNELVSYRKMVLASSLLKSNLTNLEHAVANADGEAQEVMFDWPWLFQAPTEVLDPDLDVKATMCGDFEFQSGLAVPWVDYSWVKQIATDIIRNVYDHLQVVVVVGNEEDYYEAVSALQQAQIPIDRIRFSIMKLDSPWLRDMGPLVAKSPRGDSVWFDSQVVCDGMKQRVEIDALPAVLATSWRTHRFRTALSLEGGAILSNGCGLTVCSSAVLTAEKSFGFSTKQVESEIRRITGAQQLVFLRPLAGELTNHVDLFLTFVDSHTVVLGEYRDKHQPNAGLLDSHASTLAQVQVDGRPLRVVRVPMPSGDPQLFTNYTNVVFANGVLLVPSWSNSTPEIEAEVLSIYQSLLPTWKIVQIDCSSLARVGGALHCLTSNLGSATLSPK